MVYSCFNPSQQAIIHSYSGSRKELLALKEQACEFTCTCPEKNWQYNLIAPRDAQQFQYRPIIDSDTSTMAPDPSVEQDERTQEDIKNMDDNTDLEPITAIDMVAFAVEKGQATELQPFQFSDENDIPVPAAENTGVKYVTYIISQFWSW